MASDGRWYPPELHPDAPRPPVTPPAPAVGAPTHNDWWGQPATAPPRQGTGRPHTRAFIVIGLVVVVLVAAVVIGVAVSGSGTPARQSDQSLLRQFSMQQSDLPAGTTFAVIGGGNQVHGQVTLDLCGHHFDSESLRVARHQVAAANAARTTGLSTEAVLYQSPAATAQAFAEIRQAQAQCPPGKFVQSDVAGEPALAYSFGAAPDASWPSVNGVERLALAVTVSDRKGQHETSDVVYLRRGPYLLGIYFSSATTPLAVDGQTTMEGITEVLSQKLAATPLP